MSRVFGSLNAGDIVADDVLCRNLIVTQRATFEDELDISSAIIVGETIIDPTIGGIATLLPGQIFSGALVGDNTLNIQGVSTFQGPVIVQGDSTFQDLVSIDDNLVVAGGIMSGVADALPSGWASSMQLGMAPGAYLLQGSDPNPAFRPAVGIYSNEANTQREVYMWAGEKSGNQETPQWGDASIVVGLPTGTQIKEDVTLISDLTLNNGATSTISLLGDNGGDKDRNNIILKAGNNYVDDGIADSYIDFEWYPAQPTGYARIGSHQGNVGNVKRLSIGIEGDEDTLNVTQGGHVGINITNPAVELDVSGDANVTGGLFVNNDVLVGGNLTIGTDVQVGGNMTVAGGVNIQGPLIVEGITDLCGGIQDTQLIYNQNLVGPINVLDITSTTVLADNIQVTGRSNVVTLGVPQDVEFIVRISEEYKKPFTLRLLGQGQIFVGVDGNCTMTAEIYTDDTFSTPANKVLNPETKQFSNKLTFTAIGPEYNYAGLVCMPNPFDNIYVRGI